MSYTTDFLTQKMLFQAILYLAGASVIDNDTSDDDASDDGSGGSGCSSGVVGDSEFSGDIGDGVQAGLGLAGGNSARTV
eukprot:scaffold671508_cov69-Prasinocladus_malaysianus.AAC.1